MYALFSYGVGQSASAAPRMMQPQRPLLHGASGDMSTTALSVNRWWCVRGDVWRSVRVNWRLQSAGVQTFRSKCDVGRTQLKSAMMMA